MRTSVPKGPFSVLVTLHNIKWVISSFLSVPRVVVPIDKVHYTVSNLLAYPIARVNPYRRWALHGEARHAESSHSGRTGTQDRCVFGDAASGKAVGIQAHSHESCCQFQETVDSTHRRDDRNASGGFGGGDAHAVCRAEARASAGAAFNDSQEAQAATLDRRSPSSGERGMKSYQYQLYDTKTCSRCRNILPIEQFYRSKGKPDGRDCYCRDCRLRIQKSPSARASLRRVSRKHRRLHPEREDARQLVAFALRSGRMKRKPCVRCGSLNVQAHHPDYSKPLEVVWLCQKHHTEQHLIERGRLRERAS